MFAFANLSDLPELVYLLVLEIEPRALCTKDQGSHSDSIFDSIP